MNRCRSLLRRATRIASMVLAAIACAPVVAQRTDVVTLVNGDRVTGEVKELLQGQLRYKTDSMSTVYVEWLDVVRVVSSSKFQVELKNGDFYFGTLDEPQNDYQIRVALREFQVDLDTYDVVRITPIKEKFLQQLDGSLSLGFQYTKASQVLQVTLASAVERRRRAYLARSNLRLSTTSKPQAEATQNNSLSFGYDRFLAHKWGAGGSIAFQQNDELGIQFRTLLSGNASRGVVQTNRQRVVASAGLALNAENPTEQDATRSLEAVFTVVWNVFKYKTPKTDLKLNLAVFPSLTESGRVRSEFDATLRQEFVKDFFWDFYTYFSYDSMPPNDLAASSDYGITTSLGWTF